MTDFGEVWQFTRSRLDQALTGLSDDQLNWRMHSRCHSVGEIALHIAGAEYYWASRMTGVTPEPGSEDARLDRAVIDGFLQDSPFPYAGQRIGGGQVAETLERTGRMVRPIYESPTSDQLSMPMRSPIGDSIDGRQGLIRLAQHAGYHTGQIWMLRMHPEFPAG